MSKLEYREVLSWYCTCGDNRSYMFAKKFAFWCLQHINRHYGSRDVANAFLYFENGLILENEIYTALDEYVMKFKGASISPVSAIFAAIGAYKAGFKDPVGFYYACIHAANAAPDIEKEIAAQSEKFYEMEKNCYAKV